MKAFLLLSAVLLVCSQPSAAQSANHELSESIADFAKSEGLPTSQCVEMENKLSAWQAGKRKKPLDVDHIQLDKCEATHHVLNTGNGKIQLENSRSSNERPFFTSYTFNYGKLKEINIDFPQSFPFDEVVSLLTTRYGVGPSAVSKDEAQNAFGARWNLGTASWSLPNNVVCLAFESIDPSYYVRYTHVVVHYGEKTEPEKSLKF
jgi:hypothetical protein